jgi:hypothetical protein
MGGGIIDLFMLTLGALCLGILLCRLNALALIIASAIVFALVTFYLVQEQTLVRSILVSVPVALCVQIGYLLGQLLHKPPG